MNPERRQKVLLGVLGVLALILVWRYVFSPMLAGSPDPPPAPRSALALGEDAGEAAPAAPHSLPGSRANDTVAPGVPTDRALELEVAALEAVPHNYSPGRDPWRFGEIPPPPPTPQELEARRRAAEALEANRRAAEEAARRAAEVAAQPPPPPPPPQPPPFTLRYLGSFGPAQRRIAAFTDGKEIYNVKEGGVLQGKFLVAHIGYESVDIQFVGFPDAPMHRVAPGS